MMRERETTRKSALLGCAVLSAPPLLPGWLVSERRLGATPYYHIAPFSCNINPPNQYHEELSLFKAKESQGGQEEEE